MPHVEKALHPLRIRWLGVIFRRPNHHGLSPRIKLPGSINVNCLVVVKRTQGFNNVMYRHSCTLSFVPAAPERHTADIVWMKYTPLGTPVLPRWYKTQYTF